jgi:predicted permease
VFTYILPIGLIALGLLIGQVIQIMVKRHVLVPNIPVGQYMKHLQMAVLLGISPVITLGAFWSTRLNDFRYVFLPFLGVSALSIGGLLGIAASKILQHQRKKTGAMFVSSSFTNLGSFGGLICFIFFGEKSYALVALYRLFEEFVYFLIGFPIAKFYGSADSRPENKKQLLRILTDPFILVYLISITTGIVLNLSGIARPAFYTTINEVLIPLTSILLVITVGFNMKIKAIGQYQKECWAVAAIKFLFIPAIITSAAYILGIADLGDGLAFKVVFVLSAMPPAFFSLIPPQLYNLDTDLANSTWLFCTGALVLIIPVLFLIQRSI